MKRLFDRFLDAALRRAHANRPAATAMRATLAIVLVLAQSTAALHAVEVDAHDDGVVCEQCLLQQSTDDALPYLAAVASACNGTTETRRFKAIAPCLRTTLSARPRAPPLTALP